MAYPQTTFQQTSFSSPSFISRKRDVVYATTILYQLRVLKETGRYDAFKLKWHSSYNDTPDVWPVPNHLFWDSDVAKWIEGACYFLTWRDNHEVDSAVKELVDMIRSAQQPDGYLNIHFTVVDPKGRFTHLRDLHELYNAGHLIEAALAHERYYKNTLLLDPIIKYVDLFYQTFGAGKDQKHGYPGHPEIELALLRLYDKTKDAKHLELARYFLTERGNPTGQDGQHYYDVEAEARGDRENELPGHYPRKRSYWYQQAHKPIVEQKTIEGHSVRAMYLLTAVADLCRLEDTSTSQPYRDALERLWSNMVEKKMYLTGGIGAQKQWEGFGIDYFLPQGTDDGGCYAETCASIGVMMLAERLLQIDLDGKYGDIMELCFYNAVMTGMSTSGEQFTYVNQLASSDSDLSKRAEWFKCACCPPNVTRLLGYIGGYLWTSKLDDSQKSVDVNVHLYTSAVLRLQVGEESVVEIEQKSDWPWSGDICFSIRAPKDVSTSIKLRIPGWAENWKITPEPPNLSVVKGYLELSPDWLKENSEFRLSIPIKTRFVSPHPYTNQEVVAVARGPLIYCVEDVDNPWVEDHFKTLYFDSTSDITEDYITDSAAKDPYVAVTAHNAAYFLQVNGAAQPGLPVSSTSKKRRGDIEKLVFIPYSLRANRGGKGHMRVGLGRA
ncbi:Non-reducing end beta-L-arabinofuranosidase [Phlyctema vagabunda]|uniref:Non-reducing end beta-L-arabinofuranosidase n=1 Tax=Phlyctema vagabunda TaxID=108571 RepID=A0ABR4P7U9_9HELO